MPAKKGKEKKIKIKYLFLEENVKAQRNKGGGDGWIGELLV